MSSKELKVFSFCQQRFAYASSHAAKRIAQRTSMDILELMSLLDNGACVNIGQYAGSYRKHLLFFSPKDKFYYVAIQDERYGKIITVLPPAYHKNLAWRIKDEQYQLAKERHESYIKAVTVAAQSKECHKLFEPHTNSEGPRKYKILVQALYISESLKTKRKTLLRIPVDFHIDDFEKSVKELIKDLALYEEIDKGIKRKRLFQDTIYALCFRQEKDAAVFYTLTLRSQYEAENHAKNYQEMRQNMKKSCPLIPVLI
ncbi:hypothetical protein ACOBWA_09095 [Psychrobacter sp. ER1]|uniref:hypothetical protein n=1 Tax=Psychrobacter sp. ER1 TaxID=3406645 RepID=UPI003B43749F